MTSKLEQSKDKLKAALASLESIVEKKIETERSSAKEAETRLKELTAGVGDKQEKIEALEANYAKKNTELNARIIELESKLENAESEAEHFKDENSQLKIQLGRNQDQIKKLSTANNQAVDKVNNMIRQVEAALGKVEA